jgi:hypothetical protein
MKQTISKLYPYYTWIFNLAEYFSNHEFVTILYSVGEETSL